MKHKELIDFWLQHIPVAQAMGIEIQTNDQQWQLRAPLALNKNHMGTGFGGSIATMATLAGWAQVWFLLQHPQQYDIVIAESHIRYRRPVRTELVGKCTMPTDRVTNLFLAQLDKLKKASIKLRTEVYSDDLPAATMHSKFVVFRKSA